MADKVEEVVNTEEDNVLTDEEVPVVEPVVAENAVTEPEPEEKGDEKEQNGSAVAAVEDGEDEVPKENGTSAKEENGSSVPEGNGTGELKRKGAVVDVEEVAEITSEKKAKLEAEGKQDEVVDSPAEQVAA